MDKPGSPAAGKYTAYLSYSHVDAPFANRLHRALETYRVPGRLRAQGAPASLAPIFRDRSELPSHGALGSKLQTALEGSDALIVVCSPAAAESHWVNQEIQTFKRTGSRDRILAIIAAGEPPAVFPPALRYRLGPDGEPTAEEEEPIAADARPGADGFRDAMLKLAAGLLRVGFDDLKRRELHRKQRRTAAWAGAATCIVLVLAVLLFFAVVARDDADRRLTQAESLISFMLGDLRRQLQPLGRLDILDAVGDQAMAFYGGLEPRDMTDNLLATRTQALRQIGEVQTAQGRLDRGLRSFQRSLALAEELTRRHPQRMELLFELSQAHFWIGHVELARSNIDGARRAFERYAAFSRTVAEREPDNVDYQLEVVYALSNLGTVELAADDLSAALRHFEESVALNESLLAAYPDQPHLRHELAEGLSWLGAAAQRAGQAARAVSWYTRELELRGDLMRERDDRNLERAFYNTQLLLAMQLFLRGDARQAEALATEGLAGTERLTRHDPSNTEWRRLRNRAGTLVNRVRLHRGRLDSVEPLVAALAQTRSLWQLDSDNPRWASDHARNHGVLAQARLQQNRAAEALQAANEGLRLLAPVPTGNELLSVDSLRAELLVMAGDAHLALGQTREALAAWQRVIDADGANGSASWSPLLVSARAQALQRTGQPEQARTLIDDLRRRGYLFVDRLATDRPPE